MPESTDLPTVTCESIVGVSKDGLRARPVVKAEFPDSPQVLSPANAREIAANFLDAAAASERDALRVQFVIERGGSIDEIATAAAGVTP